MEDERIVIDVTKTLDLTNWIKYLIDDIIDDIEDRLENMYSEEGSVKCEEEKIIEKIFASKIIEALIKIYLKDEEYAKSP